MDAHDERVAYLYVKLKRLASTTTHDDGHRMMERKLRVVQKSLSYIDDAISDPSTDPDQLQQHQEEAADLKKELSKIRNRLQLVDVDEEDELCESQSTLKQGLFDTMVKIRKLIKCDDTKDSLIEDTSTSSGSFFNNGVTGCPK